jgi:hypothetical protein
MTKSQFESLVLLCVTQYGLTTGYSTCPKQKALIFIAILKADPLKKIAELWQKGQSEISRVFDEVLECILKLKHEYLRLDNMKISESFRQDYRYRHFFIEGKTLVGAFDGSHIRAGVNHIPLQDRREFYSVRKSYNS